MLCCRRATNLGTRSSPVKAAFLSAQNVRRDSLRRTLEPRPPRRILRIPIRPTAGKHEDSAPSSPLLRRNDPSRHAQRNRCRSLHGRKPLGFRDKRQIRDPQAVRKLSRPHRGDVVAT